MPIDEIEVIKQKLVDRIRMQAGIPAGTVRAVSVSYTHLGRRSEILQAVGWLSS